MPVALVLADLWTSGLTGADLLARARDIHPHAARALLIDWGAWGHRPTSDAIVESMRRGEIDYYIPKPWRMPDEHFHKVVTEFLHEWSRARSTLPREIAVVGQSGESRVHELRSLLARNGMAHEFHATDSEHGKELLEHAEHAGQRAPVVIFMEGRSLVHPPTGAGGRLRREHGACGPGSAVRRDRGGRRSGRSRGGCVRLLGGARRADDRARVDRRSGGSELADPQLPRVRARCERRRAAQRAYQQAWVFGSRFLLMSEVMALRTEPDRHVIVTATGVEASARTVVLATGATYRRIGIEALENLVGSGVYYGASAAEAAAATGGHVFVLGGGNSAGQAAMHLSRYAERVSLLVRGTSLADSMSQYLLDQLGAAENVELRLCTEVIDGSGDPQLETLTLRDQRTGDTETVPAAALYVLIGARPNSDWLPDTVARDDYGYVPTDADIRPEHGWPLERPPRMYETTLPGVFAVGDLNTASVARVAAAVGDGSVVIKQVHEMLMSSEIPSGDQSSAGVRR